MRAAALTISCAALIVGGCAERDRAETDPPGAAMSHVAATAAPGPGEEKIANAMRSAPDSIARPARILDWPTAEGGEFRELRAGTNDWTCYPSTPAAPGALGEDPMCLDPVFQQ
jgi:hypothetical protein